MSPRPAELSTASRDPHLTLRRVERQHRLVELLVERGREPSSTADLARALGASVRTTERDLARIRESGVPVLTRRGPGGGVWLEASTGTRQVELDLAELAALIASLAALGPTATDSAASAMRKLTAALTDDD